MGHAVGHGENSGRAAVFLGELCGNDTDDSHMPVVAGNHEDGGNLVAIDLVHLLHRHLGNLGFLLLAARVPVLEFRKQCRSIFAVVAKQQLERGVGAFHAARGVQERGHLVHHVDAAHGASRFHEV